MSDDNPAVQPPTPAAAPRWKPLGAIDRRVLGVLAEKAKTTPDGYPMSVSAICSGCNQKSNRHPLTQLGPDDVEESLQRLRQMGAVGMVDQALQYLAEKQVVEFDEERKAAMVSNLMVVLCGEAQVTPIVNTGTLYQ